MPATQSPIAPLIRAVRSKLPRGRHVLLGLAVLVAVSVLAVVVAIYTPIAHPRDLEVKGAEGPKAAQIQAAIEETAREQSTFAVDRDALLQAVADYPEVAGVEVSAHPPMRLDITVVMRLPVALVDVGGRAAPVASDGTVLDPAAGLELPRLDRSLAQGSVRDGRLTGSADALRLLAAAPAPLLGVAESVHRGRTGIEVVLERGPRLIFGTAEHARDKWAAASAVLAEGSAAAGSYIDLRVPSRPAVGGIGGSRTASAEAEPPVLAAPPEVTPAPAEAAAPTTQGAGGGAPAQAAPPASGSAPVSAPAQAPEPSSQSVQQTAPAIGSSTSGGVALTP